MLEFKNRNEGQQEAACHKKDMEKKKTEMRQIQLSIT